MGAGLRERAEVRAGWTAVEEIVRCRHVLRCQLCLIAEAPTSTHHRNPFVERSPLGKRRLKDMELWLVDQNNELVNAWKEAFSDLPHVFIRRGDILSLAENAIVSPANSLGMMDGGIDLAYLNHFGLGMQSRVFEAIAEQPDGMLPVGAAVVVETGDAKVPLLVCAPTMVTPEPVPRANAFFAMSAALSAAERHAAQIRKLFCPGLATGIGCVAPADAAAEMAHAYRKWLRRREMIEST